jgi:HlyD family secretion protein
VQINLDETIVRVPPNLGEAVVEVIGVRPGDLVQPNQPVVRVLRVEDLWVKIFVPETQYGLVKLHQQVDVTIDSHPGQKFKGVVIQRSNISEFTPRNVQSVDERRHQVFGVKILVNDEKAKGILNGGMAAEVTITPE